MGRDLRVSAFHLLPGQLMPFLYVMPFELTNTSHFFLGSCTRRRHFCTSLFGREIHLSLGFSETTGSASLQVRDPNVPNNHHKQLSEPKLSSKLHGAMPSPCRPMWAEPCCASALLSARLHHEALPY